MNPELIQQYAEFAVKIGVNPQPGQTLLIRAPIEGAAFARSCAKAGYDAGAREVVVHYSDEKLSRIKMERTAVEALEDVKPWIQRSMLDYVQSEGGACVLTILASDPEIYKGLDMEKIDRAHQAAMKAQEEWRGYMMNDRIQWSIAAIPSPAWARTVFPGEPEDAAMEKLWDAIFDVCRVKGGNVVSEWRAHVQKMVARRDRMNELALDSVRLQSANGTDLTVGLAEDAVWEGARHIGELALVPASSPINRRNLLFYNTLFDENAACHIAFGKGYPGTVKGGTSMTPDELLAKGVNDSLIHEDIMVGAPDMTITGTTKSGETVKIFEDGEWAF